MTLFERNSNNPILKPSDWPYPINSVFNPGATRLADGRTLLLCRCEDYRGISHLCKAVSDNGIDGWTIDSKPTFEGRPRRFPEELWGVEDPRITFVDEFGQYAIAYTAFGEGGPGVALAFTKDFVTYRRRGLVMQPEDKDAALFPKRFKEGYALIHRPVTGERADMWVSYSPDLKNWGRPKLVMKARRGAWWDANKIGLSPPPIETSEGWLVLYHGVRKHASGSLYRVGAMLLDLNDPTKLLRRGHEWIFGPEADYERQGDVPNVVFPTGWTVGPDNDTLFMYYGCADTAICLATTSIQKMLDWLMQNGRLDAYLEEESMLMTDIPGQPHSAHEPVTSENIDEEELELDFIPTRGSGG
ncbi:MAG: 1,4-beta-mannosyl-N-acetylglucosamine phosphorylase [Fimbriimonadaceae bacterium]|nr:1,4-beta-mannosyl-N-acetylglucosamine phosphorylase [Fimbriimonadaceae bacterium]